MATALTTSFERKERVMSAVLKPTPVSNSTSPKGGFSDFKVADLSLAAWGRKEIAIA